MMKFVLLGIIWLFCASLADARECATLLPEEAGKVIQKDNPMWTVVKLADLPQDDRELFESSHRGQCPGVASGYFRKKSEIEYVVTLIQRSAAGGLLQKLVLAAPQGKTFLLRDLVQQRTVVSPFTVWKLLPGNYAGLEQKHVVISNDSFVFEKIEASATQYYFVGNSLRSLPTAD